MRISKISYGFTKPTGVFANDKIMIEVELHDHECEMKALRLAKETADKFFNECNPNLGTIGELPVVEQPQPKTQSMEERFTFLIRNATSIGELNMYEKTANNPQYPQLLVEYNNRLKQLID
jgi:hypothetical protein